MKTILLLAAAALLTLSVPSMASQANGGTTPATKSDGTKATTHPKTNRGSAKRHRKSKHSAAHTPKSGSHSRKNAHKKGNA
jgi:hypothetical protein